MRKREREREVSPKEAGRRKKNGKSISEGGKWRENYGREVNVFPLLEDCVIIFERLVIFTGWKKSILYLRSTIAVIVRET